MISFFKKLFYELLLNGKMLISYLLMEIPTLTDYPMLVDAVQQVLENPNAANLTKLAIQIALAGSAGHRVGKILARVLKK